MTEFKVGDIVRLTKGEPDKPGFVEQVKEIGTYPDHLRYESVVALTELPTFIRTYKWTVELIERTAPPLPTKPNTIGWAMPDGTRHLVRLGVFGKWEAYNKDGGLVRTPHPSAVEGFEEAMLIPKELASKVMEWAGDEGGEWRAGGILEQIAEHLKGQDDD